MNIGAVVETAIYPGPELPTNLAVHRMLTDLDQTDTVGRDVYNDLSNDLGLDCRSDIDRVEKVVLEPDVCYSFANQSSAEFTSGSNHINFQNTYHGCEYITGPSPGIYSCKRKMYQPVDVDVDVDHPFSHIPFQAGLETAQMPQLAIAPPAKLRRLDYDADSRDKARNFGYETYGGRQLESDITEDSTLSFDARADQFTSTVDTHSAAVVTESSSNTSRKDLIEHSDDRRRLTPFSEVCIDSSFKQPTTNANSGDTCKKVSTPRSASAKKVPHSLVEKRYRDTLNMRMQELRQALEHALQKDAAKERAINVEDGSLPLPQIPVPVPQPPDLRKVIVLIEATSYIRQATETQGRLEKKVDFLQQRIDSLEKIEQIQGLLVAQLGNCYAQKRVGTTASLLHAKA